MEELTYHVKERGERQQSSDNRTWDVPKSVGGQRTQRGIFVLLGRRGVVGVNTKLRCGGQRYE